MGRLPLLLVAVVGLGAARPVPLVDAARNGNLAAVRALLRQNANVNTPAVDGTTALEWAVHRDDVPIADALLSAGANVNAPNRYGVTAIALAAENGSAPMLERLLAAGADPNVPLPGGETPLHTAARTGRVAAIQTLLRHGAQVDARESLRGQTPLMWAAAEGYVGAIEALLAAKADIHARSTHPVRPTMPTNGAARNNTGGEITAAKPTLPFGSMTPLLFAVRRGQLDAVRTLLDHGANPNDAAVVFERTGASTALMLAIANANYEVAALLLDRGADPNVMTQGWTALHQLAIARSEPGRTRTSEGWTAGPQFAGNLSGLDLARKLISKGADVNARATREIQIGYRYTIPFNKVGGTPFAMAAKAVDYELMKVLAEHGADPNISTNDHTTPLMIAAGVGQKPGEDGGPNADALEAVKLCLSLETDIQAANDAGWTALHGAAYRGSNEIVQLLVDHGGRLDARTKYGRTKNDPGVTPLGIADGITIGIIFFRQPETAAFIRQLMATKGMPVDDTDGAVLKRGIR
jgi:ankyrin repeat protein